MGDIVRIAVALTLVSLLAAGSGADEMTARQRWDFKLKDFVIGAWWGPGPTEPEVKLYAECGFNVVMCGRYMELGDYGRPGSVMAELDLAHKYGLGAMLDTYTMNDKPWGGTAGPYEPHPTHHPASLIELQWLHQQFGRHPALVGYMIGDDQGSVGERSDACTRFLFEQGPPHLMPWLCGWIPAGNLALHNNPFANPQIYPTLYNYDQPAAELIRRYAAAYATWCHDCQRAGVGFWPMFNVAPPKPETPISDSLARFPAYAAVAYGAQGIWYFCYNGGSLQVAGDYHTEDQVRAALTPLYPVAKEVNHRIAAWGPKLLGRRCIGLFGTAFAGRLDELMAVVPAPGKLVQAMSDDLLVGLLTRPGEAPLAMVVDCRADKAYGALAPREVDLRFAPAVTEVTVLEGDRWTASGREVRLTLQAGGGQLLELRGEGVAALLAPP